jgi:uncharacterized protein YndB with AHSA1/START domain
MPEQQKRAKPIRQSADVDCPIREAFELFTARFGAWWPLAEHSVTGNEADTCVIEPWTGGRVFERSYTGEEHDWGSVTCWDPPRRLSFTWNWGDSDDGSQTVDVRFEEQRDGTRVTLTHTGWETPGIAVCTAGADCNGMGRGALLHCFCRFVIDQLIAA